MFEAALTGRAALDDAWSDIEDPLGSTKVRRATSMIDLTTQTEEEMEAIRLAVVEKEGLLLSVFDVLRRVPRRVLMVLKLNDLTRSLDRALATTHSNVRPFHSCDRRRTLLADQICFELGSGVPRDCEVLYPSGVGRYPAAVDLADARAGLDVHGTPLRLLPRVVVRRRLS